MYQSEVGCVFAVNVCLSSKIRSGFGWHDCYLTYVHMYVHPHFIYYLYNINGINEHFILVIVTV